MNSPRLVIVDDEPNIGAFIREISESQGFETSQYLRAEPFINQLKGNEQKYTTKSAGKEHSLALKDLQIALINRDIIPYYQPQIVIASGELIGVEALARWLHPEQGLILPNHFIPLAEANGLIENLTWIMLEQISKDWKTLGIDATISVNLTASMFKDLTLPNRIFSIIGKYQLDPSQLILEATESALIEELAKSIECLTRLRMKGFQLSIDDFGTGHSSLIQLHRIPFSEIKIDKSFIMKMTQAPEALAIVETVIILSQKLNMHSVAEGIEDNTVLEALKKAGCNIAQGYHFAKPMPYDVLESWLQR